MNEKTLILAWFRVDQSRSIGRLLLRSALILLAGSVLVAGYWTTELHPPPHRWAFGASGGFLCVIGPLTALLGLRKILSEDAYVALRTDGVFLSNATRAGGEQLIGWDDFIDAAEEGGATVLSMRDGSPLVFDRPLAGADARVFARQLAQMRRRLLLGIPR